MDKFAIFILSKGRPNDQITYKMLRDSGYTGDIRILCDNMDDTIDEYRKKFGDEVLMFDKVEWSAKSDRITNEDAYNVLLPARNAATEIAKDLGYTHYMQMDDDISRLAHRFVDDEGMLRTVDVTDLDGVLKAMLEFLKIEPVVGLTFGWHTFYQYGKEGRFKEGLIHDAYTTYMMSVSNPVKFRGNLTEDFIGLMDNLRVGRLLYAVLDIMYLTPEQGSNEGGLQDVYESNGQWMVVIYALIANPGNVKIKFRDSGEIGTYSNKHLRAPKVLSERCGR